MPFSLETYALAQVADVKTSLDISASTWDQLFIDLVNSATDAIEFYCGGRRFGTTTPVPTYTNEVYESDFALEDDGRANWLQLKNWPVLSVTSVQYRTGTTTYNTYDTSSYETYLDSGQIYFYGGVPRGPKAIRVTYQAGYLIDWASQANHTLPHDLTRACIKLVAREFDSRKAQGKLNESVGGASITWKDGLPEDIKSMLSSYRRKFL